MASFSDVGSHCSERYCGQKDFLPFKCDCCLDTFCLDHFRYKSHNCAKAANKDQRVAVCPICQRSFALDNMNEDNVNLLWQQHVESGQCKGRSPRPAKCPVKGCKETLTTSGSVTCAKCRQKVCLKHRYEDSHDCKPVSAGSSLSKFWSSAAGPASAKSAPSSAKPKSTAAWPCGRCGRCDSCKASRTEASSSWSCAYCTLLNPSSGSVCGACGNARQRQSAGKSPRCTEYECPSCKTMNPLKTRRCRRCGAKANDKSSCTIT